MKGNYEQRYFKVIDTVKIVRTPVMYQFKYNLSHISHNRHYVIDDTYPPTWFKKFKLKHYRNARIAFKIS